MQCLSFVGKKVEMPHATIRLGARQVVPGRLLAAWPFAGKGEIAFADVERSTVARLKDLSFIELARVTGHLDLASALAELKEYYPEIAPDSIVTVISFKEKQCASSRSASARGSRSRTAGSRAGSRAGSSTSTRRRSTSSST